MRYLWPAVISIVFVVLVGCAAPPQGSGEFKDLFLEEKDQHQKTRDKLASVEAKLSLTEKNLEDCKNQGPVTDDAAVNKLRTELNQTQAELTRTKRELTEAQGKSQDLTKSLGPYVVIAGDDDKAAVAKLLPFLQQHGMKASSVDTGDEAVFRVEKDWNFFFFPKTSANGLDRLVIKAFIRTEDRYKNSSELTSMVLKLNQLLNCGQFYLDSDSDVVFLSQLTFDDLVSFREVANFATFLGETLQTIPRVVPNAYEILK